MTTDVRFELAWICLWVIVLASGGSTVAWVMLGFASRGLIVAIGRARR